MVASYHTISQTSTKPPKLLGLEKFQKWQLDDIFCLTSYGFYLIAD